MARSCASQGTRRGSLRPQARFWIGIGFHAWLRIRRGCRPHLSPRAGSGSRTFDCMGHHGPIGRGTTRTSSRRLRGPLKAFRPPRRCGACSTTPPAAPPSRMPGNCSLSHMVEAATCTETHSSVWTPSLILLMEITDANETGRAVHVQPVWMRCQSDGGPVGRRQRWPGVAHLLRRKDVAEILAGAHLRESRAGTQS